LITFHLPDSAHVFLYFLGSPSLLLLLLLLCHRCILLCRCLLLCCVELCGLRGITMKAFLNLFRQFIEIDFRDYRFGFQNNAVRLDVADCGIFYSLPLTVLKSSAKAPDGKRMTEIRMLKKKRQVMHTLLAIRPNTCKRARRASQAAFPKQFVDFGIGKDFWITVATGFASRQVQPI
jgi:hypothetical protein